jgi:hypothetical protein
MQKAMKVTYPDGTVEIVKDAVEAKKIGGTTMEFRDEAGAIVRIIEFNGLLRYETVQIEE